MNMDLAVCTKDLSKTFGKHQVLNNINIRVPTGSCYGFVGANGAGKTTTMRIPAGLAPGLKPRMHSSLSPALVESPQTLQPKEATNYSIWLTSTKPPEESAPFLEA